MGEKFDAAFDVGMSTFNNLLLAGVAAAAGILFLVKGHGWTLLLGVGLCAYAIYGLYMTASNWYSHLHRKD